MRKNLGARYPAVLRTELGLANILALQAERTNEAVKLVEHGLSEIEHLGATNPDYLLVHSLAIEALARLGKTDDAQRVARELLSSNESIWGTGSSPTLGPRRLLALALLEGRRADTALVIMRDVVSDASRLLSSDNPRRVQLEQDLGTLLMSFGEADKAEHLLNSAYRFHSARDGESSPKALLALQNLAGAISIQGRKTEALGMLERIMFIHDSLENSGNDVFFASLQYAELAYSIHGPKQSLSIVDKYLPIARNRLQKGSRPLNMLLFHKSSVLKEIGNLDSAENALLEIHNNYLTERGGDNNHPDVIWARSILDAFYETTDRERI